MRYVLRSLCIVSAYAFFVLSLFGQTDRGTVTGTSAGDSVRVWFTAKRGKTTVTSPDFTYQVATDIGGDVLVLAAEDVTGASPVQAATSAKYAASYAADLAAAGYTSDVYDVDTHGRRAPHHLGVLSHYDAVVWETGDDIIPRVIGQPGGTAAPLASARTCWCAWRRLC